MKKIILCAVVATASLFMSAQTAEASCCCKPAICLKKKVCTQEVCRREYCTTKCSLMGKKTVHYVEITYKTTYKDCCGKCSYKTFKKVKRLGATVVKCCKPKPKKCCCK